MLDGADDGDIPVGPSGAGAQSISSMDEMNAAAGISADADVNGDDEDDAEHEDDAATGEDMAALAQQMLAVEDPDMVAVDQLSLLATEYTPLAPGVRWLRFNDVAVVAPIPRDWVLRVGIGRILGIPYTTYAAAHDDDSGGAASGGGSAPPTHPQPASNANVSITVTQYRGAFASQLLAASHGSARDVCRFFAQMHVIKRSPPGLVTAETFAGEADGGGAHTDDAEEEHVRGSSEEADEWNGGGSSASSGGASRRHVPHSSPERKPDVVASWHKSLRRADVMGAADAGGGGGGGAVNDSAAAPSGRTVRVPVAYPAQEVFARLKPAVRGQRGGASAASPATGSSSAASATGGGVGCSIAADNGIEHGAMASGSWGSSTSADGTSLSSSVYNKGNGSGTASPPVSLRDAVIRASDPIDVYGLEYIMRYTPTTAASASASTRGGRDSDTAASNRSNRHSTADEAPTSTSANGRHRKRSRGAQHTVNSRPSDVLTSRDWGMRYSVTLISDPAADSLHEITFSCPAIAWEAVWAHENDDLMAPPTSTLLASSGRRSDHRPPPTTSDAVALAGTVGLLHVTGAALMEAVTVTGVVDFDAGEAARRPAHDMRGY